LDPARPTDMVRDAGASDRCSHLRSNGSAGECWKVKKPGPRVAEGSPRAREGSALTLDEEQL